LDRSFYVGENTSVLSRCFIVLFFFSQMFHSILVLNVDRVKPRLLKFAKAVYESGAPLTHYWGFIDGLVRGIARPVRFQRLFYSGHERKHATKFQGVLTPDGIFVDLWGPVSGTRHDTYILAQSGLMQKFATLSSPSGHPYCLCGDPAYGISNHIVCPFRAASVGP
ncbi:unnamed protein product, partial [Scytosiphon promiscuus]